MRLTAYIALGANLGDPVTTVRAAFAALREMGGATLIASSSLYRTAPVGLRQQPDFINAVAALAETEEGLGKLDEAEALAGRVLTRQADHANGNLVMGLVLMQRGRYAEARDAFAKTAAAQPNLPKAFYQLSLAHARLGDEANADKYQQLYRESQRRMEERVNEIRTQTGMPGKGGMSK